MFTGIVQGIGTVTHVTHKENARSLVIELPAALCQNVAVGASVAINGTCLTLTQQQGQNFHFDVIEQTLALTNLSQLITGSQVNIERSVKLGDEIGGHILSGHVADTIVVIDTIRTTDNTEFWFATPKPLQKYILPQGFVALNGCSLTIAKVDNDRFCVCLIPETLRATTFGTLSKGDPVNLEIDHQTQIIVATVERVLGQKNL